MYLHPEMETLTRPEIEKLQLERLQKTVRHCMNSPFYKKRFEDNHLKPEDIRSLNDLRKIPFTTKQDLRDTYPFGMAAVPLEKAVRLHSSSGTTGNPTVILHTQKDLDEWANAVARCLYMVGLRPGDIFQNSSGYGMFTGGLGFQYGAERMGMLTVPAAAGNTKRQLKFITDFGTTALHAIPSYAARLYEVMEEMGIDPRRDTKLKTLIIGAEPHSEEQRRRIEDMLGVKAYNSFGMSEMCGPGVAFECREQNGLHIWEDYYIVEIINPDTLEPVPDGEVGELVITTLTRECSPMIRYRTRDVTTINAEPCACGRTHRKIGRLLGRTDDMLIIRGVNVFPSQIEQVITEFPEIATQYQIILTMNGPLDHVELQVETEPDFPIDEVRRLEDLRNRLAAALKSNLQVAVDIKFVEPKTIARSEGKAKRVIDLRGENQ